MSPKDPDLREIDSSLGCIWFTICFWGFGISLLLYMILEKLK